MKRLWLIGLVLLAAGVAVWQFREMRTRQAEELLRLAYRANRAVSFSGVAETSVPLAGRPATNRARVLRGPNGQCRIEYLDPPAAETISACDGRTMWRQSKGGALTISPVPIVDPEIQIRLLLHNYRPALAGREIVAGRPTQVVRLVNRTSGQVRRTLWLDEATHVILAQETRGEEGRLVARTRFQSVSFDTPALPQLFAVPRGQAPKAFPTTQPASPEQLSAAVKFRVLLPYRVPRGFRFAGSYLFRCPCGCAGASAQLQYSDGLSSFSVFETSPEAGGCNVKHACAGPGQPPVLTDYEQAKALGVTRGDIAILVVGDLDTPTLIQIARSAR